MNSQGYLKLVAIRRIMDCLVKLVGIIMILQLLQITLAFPDRISRQRKIAHPEIYYAHAPAAKQQVRRTSILNTRTNWETSKIVFNSNCNDYASYLKETFDNINDMLDRAQSGLEIVKGSLGKAWSDMSSDQVAKLDMFMSMYGIFNPTNDDDNDLARSKIGSIEGYVQILAMALSDNSIKITVFCNDNHLRFVEEENGDDLYGSSEVPSMVPYAFTGKCQGDQQTLAIMGATNPSTQDVMTICPRSWTQWESRHISEYYGKDIADIKDIELNSIANESPEVTLLHELTHTTSLFGTAAMFDHELKGERVYEFWDCFDLAEEYKDKTDLKEILPLTNAETFAYFCAAMYLDMCNWSDGICEDPASVE